MKKWNIAVRKLSKQFWKRFTSVIAVKGGHVGPMDTVFTWKIAVKTVLIVSCLCSISQCWCYVFGVLGWCQEAAEGWSKTKREARKENGKWSKTTTSRNVSFHLLQSLTLQLVMLLFF